MRPLILKSSAKSRPISFFPTPITCKPERAQAPKSAPHIARRLQSERTGLGGVGEGSEEIEDCARRMIRCVSARHRFASLRIASRAQHQPPDISTTCAHTQLLPRRRHILHRGVEHLAEIKHG
eukprot:3070091-Rhodomonas_salina.3